MAATVAIPRELRRGEVPLSLDAQQDVRDLQTALNTDADQATIHDLAERISQYYQERTANLAGLFGALVVNDFTPLLRAHVFNASYTTLVERAAESMTRYLRADYSGDPAHDYIQMTAAAFQGLNPEMNDQRIIGDILDGMARHSNSGIRALRSQIKERLYPEERLATLQASGVIASAAPAEGAPVAAPAAAHPHAAAAADAAVHPHAPVVVAAAAAAPLDLLDQARAGFLEALRGNDLVLTPGDWVNQILQILSAQASTSIGLAASVGTVMQVLIANNPALRSTIIETLGNAAYPVIINHLITLHDFPFNMGERIVRLANTLKEVYHFSQERICEDVFRAIENHPQLRTLSRLASDSVHFYLESLDRDSERDAAERAVTKRPSQQRVSSTRAVTKSPSVPRQLLDPGSCCLIL